MPGRKKLINLRRTNRFRFVQTPDSMRPGPSGVQWSSCNSTMEPGKGSGSPGGPQYGAFQTATGVTYLGWKYQQEGLKLIAQGFGANVLSTGMNLPTFIGGVALFNYGSAMTAKFTRPCSEQDEK